MMQSQETLWDLLRDPNHWIFEIILMILFDFVIGVLLWPRVRRAFRHHEGDDASIEDLQRRVLELEKKITFGKEK
jgi:hypothetical protein